jgi:hypothetical protein
MGKRRISGFAQRLTCKWANKAVRRSIIAPDRETTMERRHDATQCR